MFFRNRFLAVALAAFGLVVPNFAEAQINLLNLPSGSVVGRTTFGSGPAQVIPFQKFLNELTNGATFTNATINGGTLTGSFTGAVFTNGNFVNAPTSTFKCNPTSSSAAIQDCTISGLTARAAPDPISDQLLIFDSAASQLKSEAPAFVSGRIVPLLDGGGSNDNCARLNLLNTQIGDMPGGTYDVSLSPGNYVVNCNITLQGYWHFSNGASLTPGTGFTITFANVPDAPPTAHIFNLYNASTGAKNGGNIAWNAAEIQSPIWAEWFGVAGDFTTLHNEVGMQLAINSLYPVSGGNGGLIRVTTGVFQFCGGYTVTNNVSIQGMGRSGTEFLANASCWNGDDHMIFSVNGTYPNSTISQFGCWTRDLELNANSIDAITNVINAASWQEDSGLERVLVINFMHNGVYDQTLNGAADFNLYDVEFFWSASATGQVAAVQLLSSAQAEWTNVNFRTVTMAGGGGGLPSNQVYGVLAFGRMTIVAQGMHFENSTVGISLNDRANLVGDGFTGGPGVGTVVEVDPFSNSQNASEHNLPGTTTQISRVYVSGLVKGSANNLFQDQVNGTTTSDQFAFPFHYP